MRATTFQVDFAVAEAAYAAFEAIPGALDSGALIIYDHASQRHSSWRQHARAAA